jgi:hypothetical protein
MSNLVKHAENELKSVGMLDSGEEMNEFMCKNLLDLIKVFSEQGHSGMSASYCVDMFSKLARFEPLGPLTGEDWEWVEIAQQDGPLYQNIRCSHVFKDNNGAYDIDGKVFIGTSGGAYTNKDSRVPVTFPYTPKTEYVNVL